jgi:hypothetical protein
VKKYIRNMSYKQRVTDKIRSARCPLIMGRRDKLRIGSIGGVLESFWGIVCLGESSEKGYTRKHTEKWVTR